MTIKEANEIRKDKEGHTPQENFEARTFLNKTKNTLAEAVKEFDTYLEDVLDKGVQLSMDLGPEVFSASMVDVEDISFDCSDEDLYSIASSCANLFCTHNVDKTAMKKAYKNGTLHPDLIKHVVINTQQSLKFTKKAKKGE